MPPSGSQRGKYLGFVAHEIKNPLATALWSCDLLKRMDAAERNGERAEKMIDVSLRALRRMRRLIDDYFTIERLLEHGYELRREQVALSDLIQATVQVLSDKDGVVTEGWVFEVGAERLACDAEMMKRGLRALLEYAAREKGTRLTVSAHAGERTCELLVRADPAPGGSLLPPPPEERQAGDPAGAVLGFALAEQIFSAHGGTIAERDGGLLLSLPAAS